MIDPAVVDRRTRYIGPVACSALPGRDMTISGIAGKAAARILSKDPTGPATRLVDIPSGWAAEEPGAFSAFVELFVLEGTLDVDDRLVGPHSLVRMGESDQVRELRTDHGVLGLLFTSAPVRFVTGEFPGTPRIVSFHDIEWKVERPGILTKTVPGPDVSSRLVMAGHAKTADWQCHAEWSERYVIAGEWRNCEGTDEEPDEPVSMRAGSYVCRPRCTSFDGPGAGTDTTAVLLDRVIGPWAPSRSVRRGAGDDRQAD